MTLPAALLSKCANPVFIETGSYDGRTIQMALDNGFQQVRSIEVSPDWYNVCLMRFGDNPNVKLFCGDSEELLEAMIADLAEPATFWLDAHIQEGIKGKHAAPLLYELDIIARHPIKTHTILIDDKRLMGLPSAQWSEAGLGDVMLALYGINKDYSISYEDSLAAPGDIIWARLD
jgi:hypothetical protein